MWDLLAAGQPYLEVSAHHYTTENLTSARHTNELEWQPEVTLNLDYRQMGLGGASCGPATRPEYVLYTASTRFQVRLRGLDGKVPPEDLARQRPPEVLAKREGPRGPSCLSGENAAKRRGKPRGC